jgi:hypothetical protein
MVPKYRKEGRTERLDACFTIGGLPSTRVEVARTEDVQVGR